MYKQHKDCVCFTRERTFPEEKVKKRRSGAQCLFLRPLRFVVRDTELKLGPNEGVPGSKTALGDKQNIEKHKNTSNILRTKYLSFTGKLNKSRIHS